MQPDRLPHHSSLPPRSPVILTDQPSSLPSLQGSGCRSPRSRLRGASQHHGGSCHTGWVCPPWGCHSRSHCHQQLASLATICGAAGAQVYLHPQEALTGRGLDLTLSMVFLEIQCCGEIISAQEHNACVPGKQEQKCHVDEVFILCTRIPIAPLYLISIIKPLLYPMPLIPQKEIMWRIN